MPEQFPFLVLFRLTLTKAETTQLRTRMLRHLNFLEFMQVQQLGRLLKQLQCIRVVCLLDLLQ